MQLDLPVAEPRGREHADRDELVGHLGLDYRDVHNLPDEQYEACKNKIRGSLG